MGSDSDLPVMKDAAKILREFNVPAEVIYMICILWFLWQHRDDSSYNRHIVAFMNVVLQVRIVSAHRTPEMMFSYASSARERGIQVIIAGAGGAAHLPGLLYLNMTCLFHHIYWSVKCFVTLFTWLGMVAALTPLPVIGVPVRASTLDGLDSLLSIVQVFFFYIFFFS